MNRVFYGNFDFEHQLAGDNPQPALLQHINAQLAPSWIAVANSGDVIFTPAAIDPDFAQTLQRAGLLVPKLIENTAELPPGAQLVPWGWSPAASEWGARHRLHCDAPPLDAVHRLNDRLFAHELETTLACGLSGAAIARNTEELLDTIRTLGGDDRPWIIKARFGMSGRERIRGRGRLLPDQAARWAQRKLATGGALICEPWVERIAEAGLQFDIPQQGEPQLLGVTPLLTDHSGHYRGNRFANDNHDAALWSAAVETGLHAVRRIQQAGYEGPLGIDALRYRDADGTEKLRPLQDINARYTMGRLALGFRRMLSNAEVGSWLHFSVSRNTRPNWPETWRENLPGSCRLIVTSPALIGGKPNGRGSALLIAPDRTMLERCEAAIERSPYAS